MKSTGVNNNITNGSITLSVPVSQHAQHQDPKTEAAEVQPSLILLFTPVISYVKMSFVKKAQGLLFYT